MSIDNVRTVIVDMPLSVKGNVAYDPADDFYTIYINARLPYNQQLFTYRHEIEHIAKEDFHSHKTVEEIENDNI